MILTPCPYDPNTTSSRSCFTTSTRWSPATKEININVTLKPTATDAECRFMMADKYSSGLSAFLDVNAESAKVPQDPQNETEKIPVTVFYTRCHFDFI